MAHNALLINGKGQLDRDYRAYGTIKGSKSLPHIGYVEGDAQKAYGFPVTRYRRHAVMIRPSLILIVDELEASEPVTIDWLLHGKEEFRLDEKNQQLTSVRGDIEMDVMLLTNSRFRFSHTNEWPVDPKQDYPMVSDPPPDKQWHFTASLSASVSAFVLAAIMVINDSSGSPKLEISRQDLEETICISALLKGRQKTDIMINLGTDKERKTRPLIEIKFYPESGNMEELIIHSSDWD
jgi:hypothetical protein